MCPPASPHKGASIIKSSCMIRDAQIYFGMETPLLKHSGGHTGAAPTVSFGWITYGWLMSFGWIMCKWSFGLCGMVQKGMVEFGRGGACVPARVAPQGRIHHPFPAHNAYVFGMETPLCGRSGGHIGTAPTVSFGQIACGTVGFI